MYAKPILSAPRAVVSVAALTLALVLGGCKSASQPAPVDDATLSAAVQSRIAGDSALNTESIQASVKTGIATLDGTVSSEAARSLAAADAAQVSGIKTVVNNLTIQQPAPVAAALPAPPPPVVHPKAATPRTKPAPIVRKPAPVAPVETASQNVPPPPPPPQAQVVPAPAAPLPSAPAPPPPPTYRSLTIPPDTTIPVRITQTLDSATTQQGDTFTGTVATDVIIDGLVAIRQGTAVTGRVSAVQEAAHYKGSSLLTVELTSINRRGEKLAVTTEPYSVQGKGRGGNTAAKVGGGAAVGAILGGIIGGGKGAAIGAAAGGGAGAGANTITRGEQVQIPSESLIQFHLTNTLAIRVPTRDTESTTANPELQPRPENPPPQ